MKHHHYLMLCLCCLAISHISAAQAKNPMYLKGYKGDVQIGYVFEGKEPTYTLTTGHGHCFGNGLYLGGGTGLFLNTIDYGDGERFMIPVFAEIRYSFLNRKASPFIDFKGGMLGDLTMKGIGYVLNPMIGVDIGPVSIGIGAQYMKCVYGNIALGNAGIHIGLSYHF